MLIFRYLAKEIFITLVALTAILLLIFMSNQFVRYLNHVANGQMPGMLILKLMMLELPNLLGLLVPLGFYIALLVAYGRLYAESEMTVLQACGYGPHHLLRDSLIMASIVAIPVLIIMLWVSPHIATERAKLLQTSGVQTLIQTIIPGRFQSISGGKQVFYVESMTRDHKVAQHVFLAQLLPKEGMMQWDIIWADNAFAETDFQTQEDYVILQQGKKYQGIPGQANYQIAEFKEYRARLPHPRVEVKNDIRVEKTRDLWPMNNPNLRKAAELQWRFSVPLMVLTLTLVAVPLSRVSPRAGKYAKLLPAVVLYIFYANFMFIVRNWVVAGKIPVWLGLWWLHLAVALLGVGLIWRNHVKLS